MMLLLAGCGGAVADPPAPEQCIVRDYQPVRLFLDLDGGQDAGCISCGPAELPPMAQCFGDGG